MAKKLYKYMGADIMNKAFSEPGKCVFKCSYPQDFNDPYELFLTIDYEQDPHMLAFYHDTVGNIPQAATTCFSKSPAVVPMWAHYGHNHHGVVLEIDEEKVLQHLPEINFGDVDYQDEPHEQILEHLYLAHGTKSHATPIFFARRWLVVHITQSDRVGVMSKSGGWLPIPNM